MKCISQVFLESYEFIFLISDDKETPTVPTTSSSTTRSTTKRASTTGVTAVCNIPKNSQKFIESLLR